MKSLLSPSLVALLLGAACQSPEGGAAAPAKAQESRPDGATQPVAKSIASFTKGMQHQPGFLDLYWQRSSGKLFLELPTDGRELLYYVALRSGLGSNDVGLDRGQLGQQELVQFRQSGKQVLMVVPNLRWRHGEPEGRDPVAAAALREAFAESVLWGFEEVARDQGSVLVDASSFLLRDAHDIARKLPGAFKLDRSRSLLDPEGSSNFPNNTFIEALQTFTSASPGREVRSTSAVASAVTLHVRHGFVALPDLQASDYRARRFHPRSGYISTGWTDTTSPMDEPNQRRVILRHHLTRERPIVYYIDRAAPADVRQALLEGANYWAPVFEKAGFPGGFRAELMPEGMDPLDVRNNTVQWVNRSTRGWSYGASIIDPRTGQILKGHVTLGALRCRQDVLLMQGLLEAYGPNGEKDPRIVQVALDRIRQLSAHEIGHTLGLSHNFAASMDGRESVMDYPAPLVTLGADGKLDASQAYRPGCGAWDEAAIRYGYAEFPAESEADALLACIAEAKRRGLHYLSDADARGPGRSNPLANLWDNGKDAIESLQETYRVRRQALGALSARALIGSQPISELERVFVPLYLHHQYQLEAACRLVGGIDYEYAMNDDPAPAGTPVAPSRQRQALGLVLQSLSPTFLNFDPALAAQFLPPPPGHSRTRESFEPGRRDFDAMAPARASIEISLRFLLDPARAERLVQTHDLQAGALSLDELLTALLGAAFPQSIVPFTAREQSLLFEVQNLILKHCMQLALNEGADARVRAIVFQHLATSFQGPDASWQPWHFWLLKRFLEDPSSMNSPIPSPRVPPGSPIGAGLGPEGFLESGPAREHQSGSPFNPAIGCTQEP